MMIGDLAVQVMRACLPAHLRDEADAAAMRLASDIEALQRAEAASAALADARRRWELRLRETRGEEKI